MVILTMSHPIVEAIHTRNEVVLAERPAPEADPSLQIPAVGKPISHGQIVELWNDLRAHGHDKFSLEYLLRGSRVYIPPPPPKPETSPEYKALMARLRRDEEERVYQRMVSSSSASFAYPTTSMATSARNYPATNNAFASVHRPSNKADEGDDDVTMNEVHRQVMLVINFLVTIFGCAATLWILGRWWSTPARLFLTMGGSIVVGIAEVGVYYAYVWHLGDAKRKDAKVREVKEVVETWVVGAEKEEQEEASETGSKEVDGKDGEGTGVRLRKGARRVKT